MRYFIGIIFLAGGLLLILKTEWFLQNFGSVSWAEEHMGPSGGSRLFYKLVGLLLIFVGMMVITNMMTGFLMATIGKLFGR